MAFIKTDPSQTKTVVALLGVLVVALGVTAFRLKPQPVEKAASQAQESTASSTAPNKGGPIRLDRLRDPFERPAFAREQSIGEELGDREPVDPGHRTMSRSGGSARVEPLDVGSMFTVTPGEDHRLAEALPRQPGGIHSESGSATSIQPKGPKPVFVLLATVRSNTAYSAVIRTGESAPVVVEVGDAVEGGFRVRMITADHVALSDGRETVIAKRPQS